MNGERRAEEIRKPTTGKRSPGKGGSPGRAEGLRRVGRRSRGSAGTVRVAGLEERRRKARAELRKPAAAAAACLALMPAPPASAGARAATREASSSWGGNWPGRRTRAASWRPWGALKG
jgi:hypothetical protein